jgi:hypothetical protein
MTAGFEYYGQPASVSARVVQRETRIAVEPLYLIRIEADRAVLHANLKYRISGAPVYFLEVDLRGWETDGERIGPVSLVDRSQVIPQEETIPQGTAPLFIPLLQPQGGTFELTIEASREIAPGASTIDFLLPQPKAHSLDLARAVIVPADNVGLSVQPEGLQGLKPQPLLGSAFEALLKKFEIAPRQQEPLSYLNDVEQGRFAADFRIIPRQTTVGVVSQVLLDEQETRVEQTLSYRVSHEPLDKLQFDVPKPLAEPGRLSAHLEGVPLVLSQLVGGSADSNGAVRMQAALVDQFGSPRDRIGRFQVIIQSSLPAEKLIPDASVSPRVPLVMPADLGSENLILTKNEVLVRQAPGIAVDVRGEFWTRAPEAPLEREPPGALRLMATGPALTVDLAVRREAQPPAQSTLVERIWVQTELTGGARQDRAVYLFSSQRERFELVLPSHAILNGARAWLNGQPVAVLDRKLSVVLPPEPSDQPRTLEVLYRSSGRPSRGNMTLDAPTLPEDVWVRRTHWQLLLPADEHVVASPTGFHSDCAWRWNGLYFGREPLLDPQDLAALFGPPAIKGTTTAARYYLFSSAGAGRSLELRTASRTSIVFVASLAILAVGMLLIYVPRLRREVLLAASVAVLALAWLFPEPSLLLLQAGSLGFGLALVGGLLERLVSRRRGRAVSLRRGSSSIVDRAALQSRPQPAGAGSPSSTRTAEVAAQFSSPKSSP